MGNNTEQSFPWVSGPGYRMWSGDGRVEEEVGGEERGKGKGRGRWREREREWRLDEVWGGGGRGGLGELAGFEKW